MCCTPIHFENFALRAALDIDPIAWPVRSIETERKARKQIAQRALKREAEDDGNDARSGEEASDREIEDLGDDGQERG